MTSKNRFYLHSSCHPSSPTWASIEGDFVLRVECAECGRTIVALDLLTPNRFSHGVSCACCTPKADLRIVDA
jgi:hypothetical protein